MGRGQISGFFPPMWVLARVELYSVFLFFPVNSDCVRTILDCATLIIRCGLLEQLVALFCAKNLGFLLILTPFAAERSVKEITFQRAFLNFNMVVVCII